MQDNKYKRILWLTPPNFSGGLESLLKNNLAQVGIQSTAISIACFTQHCLIKKSKNKYTWKQSAYPLFLAKIKKFNPDFIIINDKAALGYITQEYISLAQTRSSIYHFEGIPCLVVDDIKKTKIMNEGQWILRQDLMKLKRWITGTQRHQPKFTYTVCRSRKDLDDAVAMAKESVAIGVDIETSGNGKNIIITCSGYSMLTKSGKLHTWVIVFLDTTQDDGRYWRKTEDEIYAFEMLKEIHATPSIKVMQNGSYDSTHFITYHCPLYNYTMDTMHMFHSIWPEAPKRLDFISSICLDFYRFWKDESSKEEKDDKNDTKVPMTEYGLKLYWRYNALDGYYTLMDLMYLILIYSAPQMAWAKTNYVKEFRTQIGPALSGSLRGCRWNKELQSKMNMDLTMESMEAQHVLEQMTGNPEFNPNSNKQVSTLVYDILNAEQIPRQKRTTVEPVFKLVATQHPLYKRIIQQIWDTKKPANNASKYGQLKLLNERFMYKLSAAGTESWRLASSSSNFWYGSNVQNVPEPMRVLFEPDDGYVLFDFDYSQSDSYFTAFESEDPAYMANMLSEHDVHLLHAAHFFKIPFEKLKEGKDKHEDWCVHKIKGVRSITKRVVYGANYLMTGYTLFLTMGQDAVIAAAQHLGYDQAPSWNYKQLIELCNKFIESYFQLYPTLKPWLEAEKLKVSQNSNLTTAYGGATRLFFGDVLNNKATLRELASFYGQAGTAGNINAFMDDFHFPDSPYHTAKSKVHDSNDIMFFFQVHDSVVGQVKADKLHLLKLLKEQMERDCTIHDRTFFVPVEGQVGLGWGKRMIDWHEGVTLNDIKSHEKKWWEKQK